MPLVTSNILDLVQLVQGQANPEATANDKGGELDSFLTRVKTVSVAAGNATVSAADYKRYRSYRVTGNTTGGRSLTLQALTRSVQIDNSDAANTQSIAIKLGSTTLNLAAGKKGFYETDGTANGLELIVSNDLGLSVASIEYVISGGGVAITTGMKGYLEIPFACTITGVKLLADQSGSIVVDIFKCSYASFDAGSTHPVSGDKITASAPPTISGATKSQDTTLTGWTTSISAGDILAFNVNSITTIQSVTISLNILR